MVVIMCTKYFLASHKIFCDKHIQIAIHYALDIARLYPRPMVLNHGIRMEHIAADLAAPFNLFHIAGNFRLFFFTLALLELQQFTFQHAHCRFTVLDLAALVLALHHDACRNMRNADGRFRFIDVLARRRRCYGRYPPSARPY